MTPGRVLRFDTFELHPVERRLLVRGQPAPVGSRAFDLLLALAEHEGALVTKDQLLDRVWPDLVVSENNLHVHVSTLRKLLGTGAISTSPGRGYRLAARPLPDDRGMDGDRPPADPGASRPSPRPAEMFGRAEELAMLSALLGAHRLVSIVGPGGVGKSMLADATSFGVAAAPDGDVGRVDVHALAGPEQLPGAVARALGDRRALLVLDGAEHLLDAVAGLAAELLDKAPRLRLLVTSQAALRLEGERVLRLGPLPVPEPGLPAGLAARQPAVALFVGEAQAADQRFSLVDDNVEAVIDVCRRLDGVPLAVKLAAQRTHGLGLATLRDLLPTHLRLLRHASRDAPARHRSLTASFEWSVRLLDERHRRVLRRLAALDGAFTLAAATTAAAADDLDPWTAMELLAGLVERSLVQPDAQSLNGYRLLAGIREPARGLAGEDTPAGGDLPLRRAFFQNDSGAPSERARTEDRHAADIEDATAIPPSQLTSTDQDHHDSHSPSLRVPGPPGSVEPAGSPARRRAPVLR